MENFMNNFNIFFNSILNALVSVWNWLISTILGQIFISIVLISFFVWLLYTIVNLGKKE